MRVHFVGIGGYGMSALAELWLARGDEVSGCDARPNARTERLARLGARVVVGHDPDHVAHVDRVVYSTDVPADLPELAAARGRGLEVAHRSELWAQALAGRRTIAVTGTHGKTTTTVLTAHLLTAAGFDPLALVGGEVAAWGGGVRIGRGAWAVAEADESDGSFLRYRPEVAVVTNIEPEHLEHYGGDFGRVVAAYGRFLAGVAPGGTAVVWAGDRRLTELGRTWGGRLRTYGEEPVAQMRATNVEAAAGRSRFAVVRDGDTLGRVELSLAGRHNVLNALAAIEAALLAGAAWERIAPALAAFRNAHRRLEVLFAGESGMVIDDYAHHPTEIRATIDAARAYRPRRLCAVFQPQRYARTRSLWAGFVAAFDAADETIVLDVYAPAGEAPIAGVSGEALARAVAARTGRARYAPSFGAALDAILASWRPGDLWLTLGAGDVWRLGRDLATRLGEHRDDAGRPTAGGRA